MKSRRKLATVSLFVSSLLFYGTSALAITITGHTVGEWSNVVDTAGDGVYSVHNNDVGDTARFNWGSTDCPDCIYPPTPFDNQFTFDGVGSEAGETWVGVSDEGNFLLGQFTYRNGSTIYSEGISAVDLDLDIDVDSPVGASVTDTFPFQVILNTDNQQNGVNDRVQLGSGFYSFLFNYLDVNYYLEVIGFSQDGGRTVVSYFDLPEGQNTQAGLYGRITAEAAPIPEPSTMALMALASLGMFGTRKKRA